MSRAQRTVLAVVAVTLGFVLGVIVWMTMREDKPDALPVPPLSEARAVAADPSIALPYLVQVPSGADGCPGGSFRSPEEPLLPPADGGAAVILPPGDDATVIVACIGSVEDLGTPEELVADILSGRTNEEAMATGMFEPDMLPVFVSVERLTSPHGDDIVVTTRLASTLLTDHYVERDGWVHGIGYMRPEGSDDAERALVEAMLASWSWDS